MELVKKMTYENYLDVLRSLRECMEVRPSTTLGLTDSDSSMSELKSLLLPPEGQEELVLRAGILGAYDGSNIPEIDVGPIPLELRTLIDETRDFIDRLVAPTNWMPPPRALHPFFCSPDCGEVISACLDSAFCVLEDNLKQIFVQSSPESDPASSEYLLPLAAILPTVSKQAHYVINGHPNEFEAVSFRSPDPAHCHY
jgi:hypothetical protein